MQIKFKSLILGILFGLSLVFNFLFFLLLAVSGSSKTSSVSFLNPDGYMTAAAVVSVPKTRSASVDMISVNLRVRDSAYLQFSAVSGQKKRGGQMNLVFTPLYDPDVVSVSQSGFGVEITALRAGSTLIQTLTNEGVKNVALVTVTEDQ